MSMTKKNVFLKKNYIPGNRGCNPSPEKSIKEIYVDLK